MDGRPPNVEKKTAILTLSGAARSLNFGSEIFFQFLLCIDILYEQLEVFYSNFSYAGTLINFKERKWLFQLNEHVNC